MNYNNWYAVQVASGCERKARLDLMARRSVLGDTFITDVEVPEKTEMVVKKDGSRKTVKTIILPGYILVQVSKETIEDDDGVERKEFPSVSHDIIRSTANVLGFAGPDKKRPRLMKREEVEQLFRHVDSSHLEVKRNVLTIYHEGDVLDVISGPFRGQTIEVITVRGNKILGQMEIFGRETNAEFTTEQVYKSD